MNCFKTCAKNIRKLLNVVAVVVIAVCRSYEICPDGLVLRLRQLVFVLAMLSSLALLDGPGVEDLERSYHYHNHYYDYHYILITTTITITIFITTTIAITTAITTV